MNNSSFYTKSTKLFSDHFLSANNSISETVKKILSFCLLCLTSMFGNVRLTFALDFSLRNFCLETSLGTLELELLLGNFPLESLGNQADGVGLAMPGKSSMTGSQSLPLEVVSNTQNLTGEETDSS